MDALVVGYGEVGKSIKKYFGVYHDIDWIDTNSRDKTARREQYDVLLICYRYCEDFVEITREYVKRFNPKLTIIFSSVELGTTDQIPTAVHCPIEGKHPEIHKQLKNWTFFVGGVKSRGLLREVDKFFITANKLRTIRDSETTEFLKLQSTTNYGVMIEYARYIKNCCNTMGVNYNLVCEYNKAYNNLYAKIPSNGFMRYILSAPRGRIGGHCVLPNVDLLAKYFPSKFLEIIFENNIEKTKNNESRS